MGSLSRCRRLLGCVAAGLTIPGLVVGTAASAQRYIAPFQIQANADPSWWSDFPVRTQLLLQNSTPPPANWTSVNYNAAQLPWGPINPQLYSVGPGAVANPELISELSSDRGAAVFNAPLSAPSAGIAPTQWALERLMEAARQLIGTPYQHLHLPQFNPAAVTPASHFSWIPVSSNDQSQSTSQLLKGLPGTQPNPYRASYGMPAAGIDCTDFTAYIYSLALGYQMHSGTFNQVSFPQLSNGQVGGSASATVLDSLGAAVKPQFFYGPNYGTDQPNTPGSLDSLIQQLQTGDLLYIGNRQGIAHVVMWLGPYGTLSDGSPSPVPLVISSHDNTPAIFATQDISFEPGDGFGFPADGLIESYLPPPGVQILPFTSDNWFYTNTQVAMRLLPTNPAPAVPAPAAPLWLLAVIGHRCRRLRRRCMPPASAARPAGSSVEVA